MRSTLTALAGLFLSSLLAQGQPSISYILPDIGAEGLNTYVEIIGPHDRAGNFGSDGFYANVPGDAVRVMPATTDAGRIVVGPIVVSWGGRMISTQIFVKPGVSYRGPVGLTVTVNGQSTTDQSFTIVTPQTLGANGVLRGGGALGSGGGFGVRSNRGAMIVDSLVLQGGNFTVSVNDPDNDGSNGNQGYLPFVLIARGSIRIDGSTVLNVNAGSPNAAAGGGGGAGEVCNGLPGSDGGAGYTSGGAGGQRSGSYKSYGVSSGPLGGSPNGILPGGDGRPSCNDPQSSGGGTGHPFGSGGSGFCSGNVLPGSGGGAGNAPGGGGGGGGHASDGTSGSASTFVTGGRATGNSQGVPIAGGSGGGSGSSLTAGGCGGVAGGGGGAIVLCAMGELENNFRINAAGGNGLGGTGAGGGSGGYVAVGSKVPSADAGRLFALGGTGSGIGGNGGPGRIRYDGFAVVQPAPSAGSSVYAGPSIDTLTYSDDRIVTLTGAGNGSDSVHVYYRREDTEWTVGSAARYVSGTRRWTADISFPSVEGTYYLVAAQKVSPQGGGGTEPEWVLSQAAANIVTIRIIPKIAVADSLRFRDLVCTHESIDSIRVSNVGDAPLVITPSIVGSTDFSIIAPHDAAFTIAPRSSIFVRVRFVPSNAGTATASLQLRNNDPRVLVGVPQGDRAVRLVGVLPLIAPQFVPGYVDLGDVCVGTTLDTVLQFRYEGGVAGELVSASGLAAPLTLLEPAASTLPRNLGLLNSVQIRIRFAPTDRGITYDTLQVLARPCDTVLRLPIRCRGVAPAMTISPGTVSFGDAPLGSLTVVPVTIVNGDSVPVTVSNAWFDPYTAGMAIDPSIIGRTLAPGESVEVNATWNPSTTGDLRSTRLCFTLGGVCQAQRCLDVTGRGVRSRLVPSPNRLVMVADSCMEDPIEEIGQIFEVRNNGTAPEKVISVSTNAQGVAITTSPEIGPDFELAPGESVIFSVVWNPTTHGVINAAIEITTGSSITGGEPLVVPIELRRNVSAVALFDTSGVELRGVLEFAPDFQCMGAQQVRLLLHNIGTLNELVTLRFANRTAFSVNPVASVALPSGLTPASVTVRFNPGAPGDYRDTLIAVLQHCSREVRLPVHGTRYDLAYSVGALQFGASKVGSASTRTAVFNNTSVGPNNARITISRVYVKQSGSPFSIASSNLPASLAPGEIGTVDIAFRPTAQGPVTADLCYTIEAPCPQEICVPLRGNGTLSNVIVSRRSLNYGTRLICEDSTLNLVIESIGSSPYAIKAVRLEGPDAIAFQQVSSTTYPLTLGPGDSLTIPYRFVPNRALHDGLQRATLTVETDEPSDTAIVVDLVGERRKQLQPTPRTLDFGLVEVTTTAERIVVFENRTNRPLSIDRLTIDSPFEIVSPLGSIVVPPWDSVRVVVRISPDDTASAVAELIAWQNGPCDDTTGVLVTAQGGIVAVGTATISMPRDVKARPGEMVSIPIIVEAGRDLAPAQARSFRATVRVRRQALLLKGARARWEFDTTISASGLAPTNHTISTDGDVRLIEFTMTNPSTPNVGDTLGVIDAVALLGDSVATRLVIDTLYWTDGRVRVTRRNGLFALDGICTVGGDRLVEFTGSFGIKMAAPNPFNPSTDIIFETVTDEPTWLLIYDGRGNEVDCLARGERLDPRPHARRWEARDLPSGLYYAILVTPARRSVQPLLLVK